MRFGVCRWCAERGLMKQLANKDRGATLQIEER